MTEMKLKGVPILRIADVHSATLFYGGFLGFTIDWEHYYEDGAPVYMQVSRAGLVLHLSENERFKEGTIIYIGTTEIEKLHAELSSRSDSSGPLSISLTAWNTKQMEIEDPFGNLLRFNEEST